MNIFENIKMALDSIRSNKMRSFLTMLGIIIGISSVIAIVSLGQGGQNSITSEFEKIGAATVKITVNTSKAEWSDWITFDDVERIKEKINNVKYASMSLTMDGVLRTGKKSLDAYFIGGTEDMVKIEGLTLLDGRFFNRYEYQSGKAVAVIDENSAKRLFGTKDVVGRTLEAGPHDSMRKVTVVGLIKSPYEMFADMIPEDQFPVIAYIPATYLVNLYSEQKAVYQIYIMADSKDNAKTAGELTVRFLENRHGNRDREVYRAETVMQQMDQINQVMSIFTTFVAAVAAISLLVGGVGVMNIMLVSVTERTREIGIRKAIGAKTRNIMFQFLTESVIISCLGGTIGLILGLAGAYGLGQLAGITPAVSPQTVIVAILFSTMVGVFFGIYPARKAAKLDPIEALRYE
jgi:putative ABC transport system permease protein